MQQKFIVGAVALIAGLGIGFYLPHGASASPRGASQFAGARGSFSARTGTSQGQGFLSGTVAKVASGSLTLDTRDGSSHVVLLTPDTAISKSVAGSPADLAEGATVIVSGATGSNGTVTASLVQLRPAGAPGMPGAGANANPAQ